MKKYKCMNCLTSFKADYKDSCPSCGDPFDVMEIPVSADENNVEKLQEQLNTAKKALTEISKTKVPFRNGCFHWEDFSEDALKAQKALAAIEKGENNEI